MAKIRINILIYLFLLIPFFKPVGLASIDIFNSIMQLWKVVSFALLLLFYFLHNIDFRISKKYIGIMGFLIFGLVYFINCVRFGNDYSNIINNIITDFVLIFFIIFMSRQSKHKIDAFMSALCILFVFWITFQFISIFAVRAGVLNLSDGSCGDYIYVFGTDNYSAFAVIPMIVVACYIMRLRNKKKEFFIKSILLCVPITFGYIYVRSISAAFASLFLLILFVFNGKWNKLFKHITAKRTLLILGIMLFMILKYNIHNYFLSFISEALEKGEKASTLNSRTIIWSMAISLIENKPLLGYGAFSQQSIDDFILYGIDHTHNLVLELIIRTGFVGAIAYIYFLFAPLAKNYKKILESRSNILVCGTIIFLILSFMDVYPLMQYQYVMFSFLYCWQNIEKAYSE